MSYNAIFQIECKSHEHDFPEECVLAGCYSIKAEKIELLTLIKRANETIDTLMDHAVGSLRTGWEEIDQLRSDIAAVLKESEK